MNCTEVYKKIELFVLGEVSKSEQAVINAHLAICPDCNAIETEYRLLVTKIEETAQPEPPKFSFVHRTHSAIKSEIRSIALRSLTRRIIAIIRSAAACLLVALLVRQVLISSVSKQGSEISQNLSQELPDVTTFIPGTPSISGAWQYGSIPSVPGSMADEVVVCGHNMYLLQEHGRQSFLAAIDIKTGKQKWMSDIHSCGYFAADDSHVYCLSLNETGKPDLIALDVATGETLWKYQQQYAENQQNPCRPRLISGGRICWTTNKTVHMISCANGKSLWTHSISEGGLLSSVEVVNNELYVTNSFDFYCLNTQTGNELWRLRCGGIISNRNRPLLAASDGEIFVSLSPGFTSSQLICIEPERRRIRWSKTVSHVNHLYAIGNMLYLRNQNIQALDGTTGWLLWSCPATGCNPVTYTEELAYFVDSNNQGCLKALDRYTGNKVWELGGMKSCNAFIKVNDTGFLKSQDGTVYAINLKG